MKRLRFIGLLLVTGWVSTGCRRTTAPEPTVSLGADAPLASVKPVYSGSDIYHRQCANCHGPKGEGVADKYDDALYGTKSLDALARYIERTMPEDKPGTCVGDDALAVAEYIYDGFYSPVARARNNPPRIEPSRLTVRQFRESVADLFGSFGAEKAAQTPGGLKAQYHQSKGMNKKDKQVLERIDPLVRFDYGTNSPAPGISADQFSIAWQGSLMAPASGLYEFRLRTANGARLYFNTDLAAGDANHRDDSDARRQPATIDLWVSSGGERDGVAQQYLLGGRTYPLRLDYFKFKEATAAIRFEWKPPHGSWTVVPASVLSPDSSSSVWVVGTPFPADDSSEGYERGTAISRAWDEAVTRAAMAMATQVENRLARLTGVADKATNRVEKLKEFCVTLASRAFRRPLSPAESQAWVERFFKPGVAPEAAVKRAVLLTLKSPEFLYPGLTPSKDDPAVASRLALALWDSLPDQALQTAAAHGELRTDEQIRAQAERMLQHPRAKAKLKEFFQEWLVMDEANEVTKDPKAYPDFDHQILDDLRESLELFVEREVWSEASDYRRLLLADDLMLNPRLAKFFGVPAPATDEFSSVKFAASERSGVLTHPFLLTLLSYHKSSSPIHRGVFLTRNILGRFLKPPPMAVEFMDDRFDPSLTMREKVSELTAKEACRSCHATINPLGFSLEHFDAVGRFRTRDNLKAVNATADYLTEDGRTIQLRTPRDLAGHAAESPEARRGFVRQLFRYAIKQAPAAYGGTTLENLDRRFAAQNYHMRKLLLDIAVTAAKPSGHSPAAHPPGSPQKLSLPEKPSQHAQLLKP